MVPLVRAYGTIHPGHVRRGAVRWGGRGDTPTDRVGDDIGPPPIVSLILAPGVLVRRSWAARLRYWSRRYRLRLTLPTTRYFTS